MNKQILFFKKLKITHGGINNIGREVILYRKNLENQYVYVEEIRPAKKEAAMQTLYIRKIKKPHKKLFMWLL